MVDHVGHAPDVKGNGGHPTRRRFHHRVGEVVESRGRHEHIGVGEQLSHFRIRPNDACRADAHVANVVDLRRLSSAEEDQFARPRLARASEPSNPGGE